MKIRKRAGIRTLCGLEQFGVPGIAFTQTSPSPFLFGGKVWVPDVEESSAKQSGWLVTQKAEASPPCALQFVLTIVH